MSKSALRAFIFVTVALGFGCGDSSSTGDVEQDAGTGGTGGTKQDAAVDDRSDRTGVLAPIEDAGGDGTDGAMADASCSEQSWYADGDGDGFGDPDASSMSCEQPAGFVADSTDCDDSSEDVHPEATESCNAADDDCSGAADDTFDCVQGTEVECTTSCGTTGSGACTDACNVPEGSDCTPPDEVCNGIDDDCDGKADLDLLTTSARVQQALTGTEFFGPRAVPNADGTFTVLYLRNGGSNDFSLLAQKVTAAGEKSGSAVTLVDATADAGTLQNVDSLLVGDTLYVAWIGASGGPYLGGFDPSTYASTKTPKAYPGTYSTNRVPRYVRLSSVDGLLRLYLLQTADSGTAIERVELAPPTGSTLPNGTRLTPISGGIGAAAFDAASNATFTFVVFLDDNNTLALGRDNGGSASFSWQWDLRSLPNAADRIRYPSIAVTATGEIAVAWAEYPDGGTPSMHIAYLDSFGDTTPTIVTLANPAPYYSSASGEVYKQLTHLGHASDAGYFVLAHSSAPGNNFGTDIPALSVMWPDSSPSVQNVDLGSFTVDTDNSNEVALAPLPEGALLVYDHSGGAEVSSQLLGCY
ncbi:MAG: putative metal-binding motif-containing protein [Myxococcales bacterium]|nr:putative metal-binding motif-containing protein [Myxococcales bacterium]